LTVGNFKALKNQGLEFKISWTTFEKYFALLWTKPKKKFLLNWEFSKDIQWIWLDVNLNRLDMLEL